MANDQHLARLKQSIAAWNQWRQNNPIRPDFVGADLAWLDLSTADLHDADLSWANLQNTVLSGADLGRAQLQEAILNGADLHSANLRLANLTAADLAGADLSFAQLFDTVLADVDLSTALGLESCLHFGPSILDHRTLERSCGLPLVFLRGCGLSEPVVTFAIALAGQQLPPSCFISYSSRDQIFVNRLYSDLQTMGVRCWLACEDADSASKWRIGVDQPLRWGERLVVVLSEHSLRSSWIEQEIEAIFLREGEEHQLLIHALRIDDDMTQTAMGWPAQLYSSRNVIDFRGWSDRAGHYAQGLERLVWQLSKEGSGVRG
ncbi:toll/interleukin-1 receptor domain-containing protein [Gloeobacter kilaueensis]|uniref:Pentapeptide repeat-containing protein n=1 Tax=Gloeobacter kilaueensis (strain ATCC BAA-2537 / CCAP 1431/1 / ULC 316 / JS1) TaxID=1183438 RepID=U5QR76_GLOK1|nr:toll/interleukin-1 receptor domain-containing protein [Gloeobacter kilaueensis]AGY60159.1 pentapeptide repeat-containing protein [Gloeobacter kilaueensis JS1]